MLAYIGLFFHYVNMIYQAIQDCRRETNNKPSSYLLSFDNTEYDPEMTRVPEDCVFVHRWGDKARVVYEGEEIPAFFANPTLKKPSIPWIWIGDTVTETDLTEILAPYMVVGNRIQYDLIVHLMEFDANTTIQYIDKKTLQLVDFKDGFLIEEDV